ncbi:putative disease resistance RPP13-like protein 1 isoform X2 [Beta vulgaris subsp. vulgaris]|uniref:putative disease resistance RPP13-like protein 1 isoform X2 n=1 Tax=Beta vulgaris subsp. vulgaris TaxID=3555 RepID=UPI002036B740|nr:putative disease resistance RPP13-like protein 1 isoform X2 [Beta vulgaris subsp. vulgaris]
MKMINMVLTYGTSDFSTLPNIGNEPKLATTIGHRDSVRPSSPPRRPTTDCELAGRRQQLFRPFESRKLKGIACGSGAEHYFRYSGGDVSSTIKEISLRLEKIQMQARDLGLSATISMKQATHPTEALGRGWRETTSLVCEPIIHGRDDKRNEIIENLLREELSCDNYNVIPIVGTGGIGKTTLAQYVYNDVKHVKARFDLKAWVCVSDVFDVTRITTAIINSAIGENVDFSSLNQAQEKLQHVLTGKRFLIVLDDIWSEDYAIWNQLQIPFRDGARGSKVIMTTRYEKIARMMIKNPHSTIIKLQGLSDDDCWHLFQQHTNKDAELAEMKEDIMKKCKGLPLAVKALAGLLKSTVEKSQRREMLNSNVWSQESTLLPALMLSYHHLPPRLKHCFAYCSIYPKDYGFTEMEVILLWMAQGFIPESQIARMEDTGHNYFLDLVSRSLFEALPFVVEEESRKFTMHDLVHDLAQWAAGDLSYVIGSTNRPKDLKRTRHLFLTEDGIDESLGNQLLASQLRTFICPSDDYIFRLKIKSLNFVKRFQYVRTLFLISDIIEELPECIGDLKHLRFLMLSLERIEVLPKSISKLCNLQTMDLDRCSMLEEVPHIRFLVKLCHLYIKHTCLKEMPLGMGKLINLQTLDKFVLAAGDGSRIGELRKLNHLHGKLVITGLKNVKRIQDAQEAQLHKKYGLHNLRLIWDEYDDSKAEQDEVDENTIRGVVEQLKPHTCIQKCVLKGYRGLRFPAWLGFPSFNNMVEIKLVKCRKCECLPPLGQLPTLKTLRVEDMDGIEQVGEEFYGRPDCSIPFPALRDLCFIGVGSWEKWLHSSVDNNKAFPCLEKLLISQCFLLQGDIPPHLPSLKQLSISQCMELSVSLPRLPLIEQLKVSQCKVLSTSAEAISCSEIMELWDISEFSGLPGHFPYLCKKLVLGNCHSLTTINQLPMTLRQLEIDHCRELKSLELRISSSSSSSCLENLYVKDCKSIVSICEIPLTLHQLKIDYCEKLQVIEFQNNGQESILKTSDGLVSSSSTSSSFVVGSIRAASVAPLEDIAERLKLSRKAPCELTKLRIGGCHSLISLPALLLPSLKDLELFDCKNMERLPSELHYFTSLQNLSIERCPKIHCFPAGGLPKNLNALYLKVSIKQPIQEWGLHLLTSLQYFSLENVSSSINDPVGCIPGPDLYLPSSLYEVCIKGFSNLKTICCSGLSSLTKFNIECCPKFESFGDNGLPPRLEEVYIEECYSIEQHLKSDPNGCIHFNSAWYSLC